MISRYDEFQRAVQEELRSVLDGREGFLYNILRYHLGWVDQHGAPEAGLEYGGPRLHFQGAMALVCCEALGTDYRRALPAAAGVELVHHFTLVHGEVQVGRTESGGRPGIWWVWGPAQAINAGDGLHALGRTTIMRLAQRGTPPERVLRAVRSLDSACLRLCEGQYMDLEFQDQLMVTEAAYLEMVERKAGALAGAAAEGGALAAGAGDQVCDRVCGAMRDFGEKLGTAWQMARDIGDLWGERGDGMTASNVIAKRKSLPVIHALERGSLAAKRELGSIYMKRVLEAEDAGRLVAILDETGARAFAESQAARMVDEGMAAVSAVVPAGGKGALEELGQWALGGARQP